jgi:hypothetical protein
MPFPDAAGEQEVDAFGLAEHVTYSSFSLRPLIAVHELVPDRAICFLLRDERDLDHLLDLGAIGATVDWPGRALEYVAAYRPSGVCRGTSTPASSP